MDTGISRQHDNSSMAESALLELAMKHSKTGHGKFVEHELQTFENCFTTIQESQHFRESCVALIRAALRNANLEMVFKIFAKIEKVPDVFDGQTSILQTAIESNISKDMWGRMLETSTLLDIVSFLLHHGVPVTSHNENGKTPLQLACELGYPEVFQTLLVGGANPEEKINRTHTPQPSESGSMNLLEVALKEYRRFEGHWTMSLYWERQLSSGSGYIILSLLKLGLRTKPSNPDLVRFFWMLCYHGDLENAKQIVQIGVDLQPSPPEGKTGVRNFGSAMHAALDGGHIAIVEFLLDIGLHPSSKLSSGDQRQSKAVGGPMTPIVYAVKTPSYSKSIAYDACELLIDAGAEEADGKILLKECVREGWVERTRRLLERGVRIDEIPLSWNTEIIQLLCDTGAKLDGPKFMEHALSINIPHLSGGEPPVNLVKYLHDKHGIPIERGNFGEIVRDIMYGDIHRKFYQQHMDLLNYLLDIMGYDINTAFAFRRRTRRTRWVVRDGDSLQVDTLEEDWPDQGELTNVLRIACKYGGTRALPFLLDAGAKTECPGLPESVLVYYARLLRNPDEVGQEMMKQRDFYVLMDRSNHQVIQDLKSAFASEISRFNRDLRQLRDTREEQEDQRGLKGTPLPDSIEQYPLTTEPKSHFASAAAMSRLVEIPKYQYLQLQGPRVVRLFVLKPASCLDEPIVGELRHFQLPQAPPFEALSYVWGDCANLLPIQVNVMRMTVTTSLHAALRRLRRPDAERWLWVDAICIDQNNNAEKSWQVSIMADIYTTAERTLVWLGEHADGSHLVFQHLRKWYQWCEDYKAGKVSDSPFGERHVNPDRYAGHEKRAFRILCQRPWFYRTWILQEVALSKAAVIVCGPDTNVLKDLVRASSFQFENVSFHPFRGRDGASQFHAIHELRRGISVERAVRVSRFCTSTDPKDKVYGIFGLLKHPPIPVDYGLSVEQIYRDFTEATIQQEGNIQALHWFGTSRSSITLPSWVPDWSTSAPVGCLPRATGASYRGLDIPSKYNEIPRLIGNDMIIRGKALATISEVSEEMAVQPRYRPGSEGFRRIVRSFEETALPMVRRRGLPALVAFASTLRGHDPYSMHASDEKDDVGCFRWYVPWDQHYGAGIIRAAMDRHLEQWKLSMAVLPEHRNCYGKKSMEGCLRVYAEEMECVCYGRRFFVTTDDTMGLAPPRARAGDLVVFFIGGVYAFVIRPTDHGKYRLIGDCLFEDLNFKNLFREDSNIPLQEFTIS